MAWCRTGDNHIWSNDCLVHRSTYIISAWALLRFASICIIWCFKWPDFPQNFAVLARVTYFSPIQKILVKCGCQQLLKLQFSILQVKNIVWLTTNELHIISHTTKPSVTTKTERSSRWPTTLDVTADFEGKLQRPHWWPGQSSWWPFHLYDSMACTSS